MSKRGLIWLGLLALIVAVGAAPAAGQETIHGFFEGPNYQGNSGSGAIGMTGWALADSGVQRVVILVDGEIDGQARYGYFRPDVENDFPNFPDSEGAGFAYQLNTTRYLNGLHTVSVQVRTNDGTVRTLAGTRQIQFINNTAELKPFGVIETPQRNAQLYGTCNLNDPNRLYTVVSGWALDLGVEIGDAGIGYVELLLNGVIVGNSRTSCFFASSTGGLTNCYGLPRLDVEQHFPFALNAPNAGFRFVLDVGALLSDPGINPGLHTLTIRAGDISTQTANIDEIPVTFQCDDFGSNNEGSFGFIEKPHPGYLVAGDVLMQGWALDLDGVAAVRMYIDGEQVGDAAYGVDTRPMIANQYSNYPDAAAPVWRFFWDSTVKSDGPHQVEVRVFDERGEGTIIGERTFYVDNSID